MNLRADIRKAAHFLLTLVSFTSLSVRGALQARCQHSSRALLLTKHLHACPVATPLNLEDRHKQIWTWTVPLSLGPEAARARPPYHERVWVPEELTPLDGIQVGASVP